MDFLRSDARIHVAGHRGLVGSAIVRRLQVEGFRNLLLATSAELDLRDQAAVDRWYREQRPDYVFLVAGTVGGILPNSTRPAEFLDDNMMIHATVIHAARMAGVKKLLYLGSSCIYPRACPQPMREEDLPPPLAWRLSSTRLSPSPVLHDDPGGSRANRVGGQLGVRGHGQDDNLRHLSTEVQPS